MNFPALAVLAALLLTGPAITETDLVTVTDTGFQLSFVTGEAGGGGVVFGASPADLSASVLEDGPPTRFHFLAVDGLLPGRTYYYRVKSGDALWPRPPAPPEQVTTLTPPPGRLLFSFAVINDVHAMEDIAGVILAPGSWIPPLTRGFTWRYPVDNYWEFTLRAAVAGVNRSGAELCVINGDLTSWFSPEEFRAVKSFLDRLSMPYYVTRGNHDRVEDYPEDYFKSTFGLESSWYGVDHAGFHFVFLDDSRLSDGWMEIPEEEFEWLAADLASHRSLPTFIFEHRPLGADWVDVDKAQRARLLEILSENLQVVGLFNGHSHRAKVSFVPESTGDVPHIEVPSTKEYPAGYGVVRVYEGGYMYNFFLSDCADCLEWDHITRGQYFGHAPRMLFKTLADRNLTYRFRPEVRTLAETGGGS